MKRREEVNHPTHYGGVDDPYEAIKVIRAWDLCFWLGNTVKYIKRAGRKDDVLADLKKARWYLDDKIKMLEEKHNAKMSRRRQTPNIRRTKQIMARASSNRRKTRRS